MNSIFALSQISYASVNTLLTALAVLHCWITDKYVTMCVRACVRARACVYELIRADVCVRTRARARARVMRAVVGVSAC